MDGILPLVELKADLVFLDIIIIISGGTKGYIFPGWAVLFLLCKTGLIWGLEKGKFFTKKVHYIGYFVGTGKVPTG